MIRAIHYPDRASFLAARIAGSFYVPPIGPGDVATMMFICPCGCGARCVITVGNGATPKHVRPSWKWNGSTSVITLEPSLIQPCDWHGFLRDGYWEAV